jgi:hypothetical protein
MGTFRSATFSFVKAGWPLSLISASCAQLTLHAISP